MSMSLEDRVAHLTEVVEALIERIGETNDLLAALVTSPAAPGVSRVVPTAPAPAAPAPAAPAPAAPAPAAPAPAAPAALRYDTDIGPRLVKIAQTKGRAALVAFLSLHFGVSKGADIPLDRFPEVVAKADALLAEGA